MTTQSQEKGSPHSKDPEEPDLYWSKEAQDERNLRQQALRELARQEEPQVLQISAGRLRAKIEEIRARRQTDQ